MVKYEILEQKSSSDRYTRMKYSDFLQRSTHPEVSAILPNLLTASPFALPDIRLTTQLQLPPLPLPPLFAMPCI